MSGPGGGGSAAARTDAEGFTTVVGRGRARAPQPGTAASAHAAAGLPSAPATADDADADAGDCTDDDPRGGEARDEAPGDGQDAVELSGDDLKEAWQEAQRLVETLVQRGLPEGHPVREAARQQAEAAKRAWEGARPGVGVPKRLVFAEQALMRARRSQSKMEQSIDDLDMAYEAERARRVEALHELRARTKQRESFLADLSRQAAEEFRGGGGSTAMAERQAKAAVETMEGPIRDAIQEALSAAAEGTDLHTRLSGALGTLGDLTASMERTARRRWADDEPSQDDADGDRWEEGWWGGCGGDHWHCSPWAPEQDAYYDADGFDDDAAMDTADITIPQWLATPGQWGSDDHAHARANKRWRRNDDGTDGACDWHRGGSGTHRGHDGAAPPQVDGTGAASSGAAAPAPPTPNVADMALERRRQEAWDYAQDQGAQVAYEDIARMSLEELDEWQASCLL